MKYVYFVFIAVLTVSSSSVMGYENCREYQKKNDITGFNACESRNRLEIQNESDREVLQKKQKLEADKQKKEADKQKLDTEIQQWKRDLEEKEFREKQLEIQRRQLEIQQDSLNKNSDNSNCNSNSNSNDVKIFEMIHDLIIKTQDPINNLFRKKNCIWKLCRSI